MASDSNVEPMRSIRKAEGTLGRIITFRLPPGADVYKSLQEIAWTEKIKSGVILSGLGSLKQITLRNVRLFPQEFPIQDRHRIYTPKAEPLELLSLTGSISQKDGEVHVHGHVVISSGLEDAQVYGGHLIEGCLVFSTVEIVLCTIDGLNMIRETDPETRAVELYFAPTR